MGRLWDWGPVVVWCGLIFWFSSMPDLKTPLSYDYPLRKFAHLFEYAVLFGLLRRAGLARASALAASVIYAVTDEIHQSYVPGRRGAVSDVLIDAAGALTGWFAGVILKR